MKRRTFIILFCLMAGFQLQAQQQQQGDTLRVIPPSNHHFLIAPRVGYDLWNNYRHHNSYLGHKGGIMGGISLGYYNRKLPWLGAGFDFDLIRNSATNKFDNYNSKDGIQSIETQTTAINRTFFGLGPNFIYLTPNNKFMAECQLRCGYSMIKGGELLTRANYSFMPQPGSGYTGTTPVKDFYIINDHGGYNTGAFASKAQIVLTWFPLEMLGIHLGGYFMHHFKVKDMHSHPNFDPSKTYWETYVNDYNKEPIHKQTNQSDLSSAGLFAGITIRLNQKGKVIYRAPEKPLPVYHLKLNFIDKHTQKPFPEMEFAFAKDDSKPQKLSANTQGTYTFAKIEPLAYTVSAKLHEVPFEQTVINSQEFIPDATLEKNVFYTDPNIILQGRVLLCNTQTPMPDAEVVVQNTATGNEKHLTANDRGEFTVYLDPMQEWAIYAKKKNYFSQSLTIAKGQYNRTQTLYAQAAVCLEKIDCEKAIRLQNIHYDLNKTDIREDAKPELNRLVEFLNENPEVRVELSSHTDSRSSAQYNMKLSQGRANAVKAYLVEKGISKTRIVSKGYGETKLLNQCADGVECTEEEHQLNRRTEMKPLCK